jgi:hypothetical protein
MVAGVVPFASSLRSTHGENAGNRVALSAVPGPSASCPNRWSAAYTRSIRTMAIGFPSTSYSTR